MRITYFTLDDVNRFLVRRWARRAGARVACPVGPKLIWGFTDPGAIVLDLDHLTPDLRATWLKRAVTGVFGCPVLVHGHNISNVESTALRLSGVRVCHGRLRMKSLVGWLRTPALAVEVGV